MSSNAIRPTWAPFSSALSAEERLVFSLRLMNGRWEAIPTSRWAFSTLFPVPRNPAPHGEANPAQPMANSSTPAFGLSLGAGRMGQLDRALFLTPLQRTGVLRDPSLVSNWATSSTSKRRWAPRAMCRCGCLWTAAWPP